VFPGRALKTTRLPTRLLLIRSCRICLPTAFAPCRLRFSSSQREWDLVLTGKNDPTIVTDAQALGSRFSGRAMRAVVSGSSPIRKRRSAFLGKQVTWFDLNMDRDTMTEGTLQQAGVLACRRQCSLWFIEPSREAVSVFRSLWAPVTVAPPDLANFLNDGRQWRQRLGTSLLAIRTTSWVCYRRRRFVVRHASGALECFTANLSNSEPINKKAR
jgi:hypothetical protein